jgi:predicted permease
MWNDLRLAARLLHRDRWYTLAAMSALALGIAANAAVFSLVNGILLRPLPFDAADRMVVLNSRLESNPNSNFPISYLELGEWQASVRTFDGLAGFTDDAMNVADPGHPPERLKGSYVSGHTFALIGQHPALGRPFHADDDRPGAAPVVMLGHAAWRDRYASDAGVVGRQIRVNGVPSTVIGVMPEGFGFPNDSTLWQTLAMLPEQTRTQRNNRPLLVLGRMAPGVEVEQALADVSRVAAASPGWVPDPAVRIVPKIRPFREFFLGSTVGVGFGLLLAAAGFVLLIACANVANLLLARGVARSREMTVRMSIGASRWRIVRQLLIESLLLSCLAAGAGLALSLIGIGLFTDAIAGTGAPYWFDFTLDARVFVFLASICVAVALLSGLMPALQTTRTSLAGVLNQAGRVSASSGNRRWAGGLVVAQFALTLTLLMGAGLIARELIALRGLPVGIDTSGITLAGIDLGTAAYRNNDALAAFYRRLDERLDAMPNARVTYASSAPQGGASDRELVIAGRDDGATPPRRVISHLTIGPRYFDVLGVGLRRGRTFADGERSNSAIVNERLAGLYFPGQDPVGKQIRLTAARGLEASAWMTIVGVAPNIRQRSTGTRDFDPVVYIPYAGPNLPFATLISRTPLGPGAEVSRLRTELRTIDPDLPLSDVRTLDAAITFDRWATRIYGNMFAIVAGMALLLASIGLYGVTAYSVSHRTREIGIRMALGAHSRQIWWTVTRRAAWQVATGVALGTAGAFGLGRILQGLFVAISGADLLTFAGVTALLIVVAAVACGVPARRAMRVNPVVALRAD